MFLIKKSGGGVVYLILYTILSLTKRQVEVCYSRLLRGGTWQLLCPGRTLVCVDTSQTEFNSVKKTGGAKTHKLSINEMPSHTHTQYMWIHTDAYNKVGPKYGASYKIDNGNVKALNSLGIDEYGQYGSNYNAKTGKSQSHNNLQPYMAVYMWVRVS